MTREFNLEDLGYSDAQIVRDYKHWTVLVPLEQPTLGTCAVLYNKSYSASLPRRAVLELSQVLWELEVAIADAFSLTTAFRHSFPSIASGIWSWELQTTPLYEGTIKFAGQSFLGQAEATKSDGNKVPPDLLEKIRHKIEANWPKPKPSA